MSTTNLAIFLGLFDMRRSKVRVRWFQFFTGVGIWFVTDHRSWNRNRLHGGVGSTIGIDTRGRAGMRFGTFYCSYVHFSFNNLFKGYC